ncbi:MAG: D-alanine--D-alanine ligase [Patescibacteria group bacterium]|nr:D-alanine--D-alanine ligase [Patescibacteria group bacterium]MDD5554838.1 D-alanine--D-alanine ligase [Patescibacteria group bacterium]
MPKIKIALLSGGRGGEREISLKTGEQIYKALDKEKYQIFKFDPKNNLGKFFSDALKKKFDLIFPALHGPFGEDGKLQGLLDILGIPYLFSGCLASALAMNKYKTKVIAGKEGILMAPDILIRKNEKYSLDKIIKKLSLPIVVKPSELGSSVGMSIAKTKKELEEGIRTAFRYDREVLLEKFIKGRELTVPVMGNNPPRALPVIEIIPKVSTWFDYRAKYEVGGSEEVCPAKIPARIRAEAQSQALAAYKAIGCKDLARVDFIWQKGSDKLCFLEINTIPGMTATSLVPQAAKAAGLPFSKFLDKLISQAL